MSAILVTEDTLAAELNGSSIPVLLDIYTPTCGPCRVLAPVIEVLAEEYRDKVKILKLDGSKDVNVAVNYGVKSVPCLIAFVNGQEVGRKIGFQAAPRLREWLDELAA